MFLTCNNTVAMSHDQRGLVEGGFLRKSALINLLTRGCSPREGEVRGWSREEMADR